MNIFLGKNKKILNAELWVISIALKTAKKEIRKNLKTSIILFTDSQEVFATL